MEGAPVRGAAVTEDEMAKAFLTKLPAGVAEAFEAKLEATGRTAYAVLQELAIEWVQRQPKQPPPLPPRCPVTRARPLWELLPKVDRFVREGVSPTDEAFQAIMRELHTAKGSPELEKQRDEWDFHWQWNRAGRMAPLDVFVKGCCRRDEEEWRASLPKLRQPKAPVEAPAEE